MASFVIDPEVFTVTEGYDFYSGVVLYHHYLIWELWKIIAINL